MVKKTEFTRKDGTKGFNFTAEAGDKVKALYKECRISQNGDFKNYSLKVKLEDETEIYLKISEGQYKALIAATNDLLNKELEFVEYENQFGKQVGVKVN